MVNRLYAETSLATREAIVTLYSIKGAPSGGTLATIFNLFDTYSLAQISAATKAGSMSPIRLTAGPQSQGILSSVLGVRAVPDLGTLVKSIQDSADTPLVHRSWGLYNMAKTDCREQAAAYGTHFSFSCHMNARNIFTGVLMNLALAVSSIFLLVPPVRWLAAKLVTQAGSGATEQDYQHDFLEYRGVASPETSGGRQTRVSGKFRFEGSAYRLTTITMVEGAATLLYGGDNIPAKKMEGGLLTPTTLGDEYVERLRAAGVILETRVLSS